MAKRSAAREKARKETADKVAKKEQPHVVVGRAVLSSIPPILFTEGDMWICIDNIWKPLSDKQAKMWLDRKIEDQIRILDAKSTSKLVDETRKWIMRNSDLHHDNVPWDNHGLIVTGNQWLNIETMKTGPLSAGLYCTRVAPMRYLPKAECPEFLELLGDMFDKPTIDLLQQMAGLALLNNKPKALSKALVLWGPSDSGKTVIVNILAGLISENFNMTPISFLESSHGTSAFIIDNPWVLHEAFNQGKWHFSDMVKLLIEGETIPINRKNRDPISRRFKGAVFWATNHAPSFKEATKAITNRIVVLQCARVFDAENPVGVAKRAGNQKLHEYILAKEGAGVLNWAIEGVRKALKVGALILTEEAKNTLHEVYSESNMALGFIESDEMEFDRQSKVAVADFCAVLSVWYMAERGEDRSPPSNDNIMRAVRALADPRIIIGENMRAHGKRYIGGIRITDRGLLNWEIVKTGTTMTSKMAGLADTQEDVNKTFTRTPGAALKKRAKGSGTQAAPKRHPREIKFHTSGTRATPKTKRHPTSGTHKKPYKHSTEVRWVPLGAA